MSTMSDLQAALELGSQLTMDKIKSVAECVMGKTELPTTRLDGQVAIVTGANTGIGKETARELGKRGAKVILACRDETRGKSAAEELSSDGRVVFRKLDLASFKSIKEFCARTAKEEKVVDLLVNNAGVFTMEKTMTEDGNELQFQVNHLGHFMLTLMLMNQLKASKKARIVNLSSAGHWLAFGVPSDLKWEQSSYNGILAYSNTKLANIMFSNELEKRLEGSNVKVYSVHPGAVYTQLGRNIPNYMPDRLNNIVSTAATYIARTPVDGAKTTLYCCLASDLKQGYYDNMKLGWRSIISSQQDLCKELWELSEKLTGVKSSI